MTIAPCYLPIALLVLCVSPLYHAVDPCDGEAISLAIRSGDLSKARSLAQQTSSCKGLTQLYVHEADTFLYGNNNNINQLPVGKSQSRIKFAVDDVTNCWSFDVDTDEFAPDTWDKCCSQIWFAEDLGNPFDRSSDDSRCYHKNDGSKLCCDLFQGSSSYLYLPLLKDLAIRLRVETDNVDSNSGLRTVETYDLEQDGFLRQFDVAGILWPTGYLLTLCVAGPRNCGVPEIYKATTTTTTNGNAPMVAIELGTGIGAPSIALARALNNSIVVVATDKAPHALALTNTNSHAANASVGTARLDHFNTTDIWRFRQEHSPSGFSIVLGSSLQALFDDTTDDRDHQLWTTLELLVDSSNPNAVVLLAHSINTLKAPQDGSFRLVRKISGNQFGMKTRYGESSDFEISVFQRQLKQLPKHDQEL